MPKLTYIVLKETISSSSCSDTKALSEHHPQVHRDMHFNLYNFLGLLFRIYICIGPAVQAFLSKKLYETYAFIEMGQGPQTYVDFQRGR